MLTLAIRILLLGVHFELAIDLSEVFQVLKIKHLQEITHKCSFLIILLLYTVLQCAKLAQ